MQDMAEFVQKRLYLAVVEAVAVEVGDEHADRRALGEQAGAANPEGRGVAVLAFARKEIEIDAAYESAGPARRSHHSSGPMDPRPALRPDELDAVELDGHRQHPRDARFGGGQVRPQGLLIDVVALFLELLLVIRECPSG